MALSALRVPSEMVKRRSLVRSNLASRSALDAIRLTDNSMMAASATPPQASVRRLNPPAADAARSTTPLRVVSAMMMRPSGGLALIDDDLVGEQGKDDQRHVEDDGGQVEDALGDALEMREEAQRGDGRYEIVRRPVADEVLHRLVPAHDEEEAQAGGHDEGDHLVLGQRGDAGR